MSSTTSEKSAADKANAAQLNAAILQTGAAMHERMKGETPGVFNKAYWEGAILEWAMKDPSFKVDMFRFVDVFPTLLTKDQVKQHINEYRSRGWRTASSSATTPKTRCPS